MTSANKFQLVCFPILMMLGFILLICCSGGQSSQKSLQSEMNVRNDTGLLFDGKTLQGWEITNFGPQGPVYVSGGNIILGMGDGCTGITWKGDFPVIDYKVTLEAKYTQGNDFFCGMTFPVGKDPCTLIIGGWGGSTVGLSCIDGKDASENSTTTLMKFEKDHWYNISLTVSGKEIVAMIDSVKVLNFLTANHKLSIRPEVELSKPFGIASWKTTAAIRNIRVKRIER